MRSRPPGARSPELGGGQVEAPEVEGLLLEAREAGLALPGGFDPLGALHVSLAPDRLARGLFYTPEPLVRWLWTLIDHVDPKPGVVLDPACGSGRLLLEAARRGARVYGLDPDPRALALARLALPDARLQRSDGLSEDIDLPAADLLVANPPYGRRTPDDHIRRTVAPFAFPERWFDDRGRAAPYDAERRGRVPPHERNRGKLAEHCAWFVAHADRRVRPGGTIALLTTNAWLSIPTWRFLRRYLLERWTLRLLVDFNRPSDRRSVFLPDAGVAACALVATREPPPADHRVGILDLSELPSVRARYEAIGRCRWDGRGRGHEALTSFEPRPVRELPLDHVPQQALLASPDHRLRRPTALVRRVEARGVRLSELAPTHPGVDPGDLRHLVAPDPETLRARVEPLLRGELGGLGVTARRWIERNLERLGPWDPGLVVPFLFQKDLRRWGWERLHVTYLHPRVLWRARLREDGPSPILAPHKLVVLERRERGEVLAVVTSEVVVPQHGGRLLYVEARPLDELHALCAVLNAPVYQAYFQRAGQGDKDLRVPDPARLPDDLRRALAAVSRAAHVGAPDPARLDRLARRALDLPATGGGASRV